MPSAPSLRVLPLSASLCLSAPAVMAQMFKDAALETLHVAGKSVELQRLADRPGAR